MTNRNQNPSASEPRYGSNVFTGPAIQPAQLTAEIQRLAAARENHLQHAQQAQDRINELQDFLQNMVRSLTTITETKTNSGRRGCGGRS
ncbi:hypothetical protein PVAR5_0111 [Paecilomyces variotii No. 5]|uniref:Uncharacterized protein n=1 Tax=Byssochlamys spectabilis (strain No. 5 / NBRC 109023) TaxID=1356009 RepID=V5F705_BYSSN|nr:hypothetical protein PVAR5_0111 [Paecilomyces variotii No. 5]